MNRFYSLLLFFLISSGTSALAYRPAPTPEEMAGMTRQIAADPGNSRPLQYRGLSYAALGEKEKALADYKAAQKISPNQAYLYWSYGWALFDLGDYPAALKVWPVAAVLYKKRLPRDMYDEQANLHWVPYTLALGYWGAGDKDNAFLYYTVMAKQFPTFKNRDSFEAFTDRWTQKEQTMALQMFDAWQKEIEKPGNHLW